MARSRAGVTVRVVKVLLVVLVLLSAVLSVLALAGQAWIRAGVFAILAIAWLHLLVTGKGNADGLGPVAASH